MRPEYQNSNNDDMPILANRKSTNELQLNEQESIINNSSVVNQNPITEDINNDIQEPVAEDTDMTLGTLLNTMNLNKNISRDREIEPPSNKIKTKGPSNLTIIFLIIILLSTIGYFVYNLIKPDAPKEEDKKSSSDNPSSSVIISKRKYADNDAEAYVDRIINEVNNKVLLFNTMMLPPVIPAYRNQNVYLYIDHNQNLKVMIAREQTVVTPRVVGYPVANFDKLVANLLTIPNPCDPNTPSIYVLTTLGELYYLDLDKMKQNESLATVYNDTKNGNSATIINLELIQVTSPIPITSFTNVNEIQNGCKLFPYVLLNNGEMKQVNYDQTNNTYLVDQRYFGQIDYLSRNGKIDYYIYVDKTISDRQGNVITDNNGQNFKFEKIIIPNENLTFDDISSPYVFISTDNKMITINDNDLLKISVSDKNVIEVTQNPILDVDGVTQILTYVIKFNDETTKLIKASKGVTLISIQEKIDIPIN